MDFISYNSLAWDKESANGNQWTIPVSPEQIAAARQGKASFKLTPQKSVPETWLPDDLTGLAILCLASGGGQQGPLFAALGARVTVLDNSRAQLRADRLVAEREGLQLQTVQGNMQDLSCFADAVFDLIFHPVANCFVDKIQPVWQECARVLKPGACLLAGFVNPLTYIFDDQSWDQGRLEARNHIPYSDLEQLPAEQLEHKLSLGRHLEFGHSLEEQIGGQLRAGLRLVGLYEDYSGYPVIDRHIATFMATRAQKPEFAHA